MRRFRALVQIALSGVFVLWAAQAQGQSVATPLGDGFDLDRMVPAPAGDRFAFVPEPRIRSRWCDTSETAPWNNSARCEDSETWMAWRAFASVQSVHLLEGHPARVSRLHLGGSWAPHPIYQLSVDIPLNYYQTDLSVLPGGFGTPVGARRIGMQPDFLDVGDVRIGLRFAIRDRLPIRLGFQLYGFAPTGDHERLTGDRSFRGDALFLASIERASSVGVSYTVAAYAGAGWRPDLISSDSAPRPGAKAGLAGSINSIGGWSTVMPVAEAKLDQLGQVTPVPFDASVGARLHPERDWPLWVTALGTFGLSQAPGVPQYAFSLDLNVVPWKY
jgi:hypothetical protein